MNSLLVTGGMVVDGTGSPARRADVRVRDGRINEIGPNLVRDDEQVLDASGAIVAPGFIDSHTHFDASLFWDPLCDPIVHHGVTTVLIGNCSLGLAPAHSSDRRILADIFSYVEDIPSELLLTSVPWNWSTYADYTAVLRDMSFGVNVVSLVGHSMLRNYVMGEAAWERAATQAEAAKIAQMLDSALASGARGMSCSLFDKDRQGRPVPSIWADDSELELLFKVLGAHHGVFQINCRSSQLDIKCADLAKVADMARRHDVTVLDNGIADFPHDPGWGSAVLDCLAGLQATGARIYSLMSPNSIELQVNFDQTNCFISIPAWNELIQTPAGSKRALLGNAEWRARARHDFDGCTDTLMFPTDRIHDLRIVAVAHPRLSDWIGRSLQDLVNERGGHPSDVLAEWLLENDLETRFVNPLTNRNPDAVMTLMRSPGVMLGGSDAGAHLQMFCGVGDTTLLFTRYVRERGDFSLEAMVYELSGRQADALGLKDRGRLAPGMAADLSVFALDELSYEPVKLVSDFPGGVSRFQRPPGGFRYTIVNGVVVQEFGKYSDTLPGRY